VYIRSWAKGEVGVRQNACELLPIKIRCEQRRYVPNLCLGQRPHFAGDGQRVFGGQTAAVP
jgi:hypothetical protein